MLGYGQPDRARDAAYNTSTTCVGHFSGRCRDSKGLPLLKTDALILGGHSGGPVLNRVGKVVGWNFKSLMNLSGGLRVFQRYAGWDGVHLEDGFTGRIDIPSGLNAFRPINECIRALNGLTLLDEDARRNLQGAIPKETHILGEGRDFDSRVERSLHRLQGRVAPASPARQLISLPQNHFLKTSKLHTTHNSVAHCAVSILMTPHDPTTIALTKASEYHTGTRTWIFDALVAWRAGRHKVFMLLGAAGVGKSVVLAELARLGGAIVQDRSTEVTPWTDTIMALHFFQHDDDHRRSAKVALKSIAEQLCRKLPAYRKALEEKELDRAEMEKCSLSTFFSRVLEEPLRGVLDDSADPLVVILDGLDECSEERELFDVIESQWHKLPLRLVLSSRCDGVVNKQEVLDRFRVEPKVLDANDEQNIADVRSYLEAKLKPLVVPKDYSAAVEELLERSEGLFLYLHFVEEEFEHLAELVRHGVDGRGLPTLDDVLRRNFPIGLNGVYKDWFARFHARVASIFF